jgi:hypothetical protein
MVGVVGPLSGQPTSQTGEFLGPVSEADIFKAVGRSVVRVGGEYVRPGSDEISVDCGDLLGVVDQGPGCPHVGFAVSPSTDQLLAHTAIKEDRWFHNELTISRKSVEANRH